METNPLVTIICLCYNHQLFIEECLSSVLKQAYHPIEVILVDDFSTDQSVVLLQKFALSNNWKLIKNTQNIGNCKSFNKALKYANGDFLIDLSTDDVLLSSRVQDQVNAFVNLSHNAGMVYSNAQYIDHNSKIIGVHSANSSPLQPSGDLYLDIVKSYFICSPTTMFKTSLIKILNGYDTNLKYEDWDIWVRLSRDYQIFYIDKILTQKRVLPNSLNFEFFGAKSEEMNQSTFQICQKIQKLNRNQHENAALKKRISYEMKQSFFTSNFKIVQKYFRLIQEFTKPTLNMYIFYYISFLNPSFLKPLYKIYRIKKATF